MPRRTHASTGARMPRNSRATRDDVSRLEKRIVGSDGAQSPPHTRARVHVPVERDDVRRDARGASDRDASGGGDAPREGEDSAPDVEGASRGWIRARERREAARSSAVARSSAREEDDDLDLGRTGDGLAPTSYDGTGSTGDVSRAGETRGRFATTHRLVYVADETGMINRVAGVFARRGYNIESLAVGLNIDKAIFTISAICSDPDVEKLIKQVNKLAKVRKVENVTNKECVERGLMLVKVQCEPEQRSQVLEINRIFPAGGRGGALADDSVTGDPGKNRAFQSALMKFE